MKFEIYSTSGKMKGYVRLLTDKGFKLEEKNKYAIYVEVESLERLRELMFTINHEIVLLGEPDEEPAIEIYDDYRE
jgi:hypothetical protein